MLGSLHPLSGPREGGTALTLQVTDSANGTDHRCRFFGATATAGGESLARILAAGLEAECVTPNKTYVGVAAPDGSLPPPAQMVEVVQMSVTKNSTSTDSPYV